MTTTTTRIAVAAALAFASMSVNAENKLDFGLSATAGYSDNLYRTSGDTSDESFSSIGGNIDYVNKGRRVDARAVGDLAYYMYSGGGQDELTGYFDGNVSFGLVPDHFLWAFSDNFRQGVADALQAATPGNTEGINNFSSGPDFLFRLGDVMTAKLSGRYSNVWYQNTLGDNDRYSGDLSLERRLSSRSTVGIAGSIESVNFTQQGVGPDYDRYEGYLTYRSTGARTTLDVDAGYTELSGGRLTENGPLFRLSLIRQISPSSSAYIRGGYEYNDSGEYVTSMQPGEIPGTPSDLLATPQPYRDSFGLVGWRLERPRTQFALEVSYHDESYVGLSTNDQTLFGITGQLQRELTDRVSLGITGWLRNNDYQNLGYSFDEWEMAATLSWRLLRTVALQVSASHWDRSSSGAIEGVDENRLWVGATWSPRAKDPALQSRFSGQAPVAQQHP